MVLEGCEATEKLFFHDRKEMTIKGKTKTGFREVPYEGFCHMKV